jgi:aryl-alcohol dehydrogenase-like predicted oxidoreductase
LTVALEASLSRLRTDYVDVYQLHDPQALDVAEVAEWAEAMISRGKIRCLGVGAASVDNWTQWLDCQGVSSVLLPFGVLDPQAERAILALDDAGKRVRARGVLAAGLLHAKTADGVDAAKAEIIDRMHRLSQRSGISIPRLAVTYVLSFEEVCTAVVGASSTAHVDQLVDAVDAPPIGDDVMSELRAIVSSEGA